MNLKPLSLLASSILLTFSPHSLHAEDKPTPLESKLVVISANSGIAKDNKDLQRLFNYSSNPAIRLTFIVKEKNIIQVMEKSMTTENAKGWKCASFSRVSELREAASFVIEKKGDFIEKPNETKVTGTIKIQTGTTLIPKSFTLMTYDEPFRMDDFVFTLMEDKLKVEGDHKLIKELTVDNNGTTLKTSGSSWSDDYKTYNFKGISKGAKVTFSYWDGVVTKTVKFSKK